MKRRLRLALLFTAACSAVLAQPKPAPAPEISVADRSGPALRSGYADMSPATQALQRDDAQNPAWLWMADGERRFSADCSACHSLQSLRGVAARYPAYDAALGKAVTLAGRINLCRTRHMQAAPLALEGDELLALEATVALQSRGLPIAPDRDPRLQPWRDAGRELFNRRVGQLDFSCAQCHDQHAGGRLAGAIIPQGHPTGYPIYRLEWQGLGSLQRRLRNCMTGVRAEPYPDGSDEATALELFLMQRAAGLPLETPAVRP
jgi:sulfur-oxidizing protein SoxA